MNREILRLVKRDFLAFAKVALRELKGIQVSNDRYIEFLAGYLMAFGEGSIKRMILNLPPRHLKSLLATVCFGAWTLAQNPSARLMIVSYAQELADEIARSIRDVLQAKWFKMSFDTRIKKGHARVNNFATTAGGQVYASSIDGRLTGFGADIILIDDPNSISDAGYPDRLQRTIDVFFTTIENRLDNPQDGRILLTAHRIHECDLSAALLETNGWTHVALPLIADRTRTHQTAYGPWRRRKNELLRANSFSKKKLKEMRLKPSFDLLYQQGVEGQLLPSLRPKHFLRFDLREVRNLPHFLSIDPGTSDHEDRSFSVIEVWAADGVNLFLVDLFRERCNFSRLLAVTKKFVGRYSGAPVLIEQTANGPALFSALAERRQIRAYPIIPRDSKAARFGRHLAKIIAGQVFVLNNAPFAEKFIDEFVGFPFRRHADQVDAFTQLPDWLASQDDIDFTRTNLVERAKSVRSPGLETTYLPRNPATVAAADGRGIAAATNGSTLRFTTIRGRF